MIQFGVLLGAFVVVTLSIAMLRAPAEGLTLREPAAAIIFELENASVDTPVAVCAAEPGRPFDVRPLWVQVTIVALVSTTAAALGTILTRWLFPPSARPGPSAPPAEHGHWSGE
jgi:hypothetical protein